MAQYEVIAADILKNIGGKENVTNINHCATRLRLQVADDNKINDEAISKLSGVAGTVMHGNQYQIVIGTDVANVYNEFIKLSGDVQTDSTATTHKKDVSLKSVGQTIVDFISGTFVPILGVLVAAGLVSAVLNIGVSFFGLSTKSGTYTVLYAIYQAGYYFLPVYLGYSAAKKLNVSAMMGAFLGATLLYKTIDSAKGLDFLGLMIPQIQYNTSVIPILLGVLFMKLIDTGLDRVTPKSIKFFTKPLLTMIIVVPVTLLWLGPLGYEIGTVIATGLNFVNLKLGWLSVGLIGALTPLLVMTGTNQALFPLCIAAIASVGYDAFILPGMLAANIAVGAATLAVAFYTKNEHEKQVALSAGITGVMGITEPSIFGVLIKNRIALLSTMFAAGISGALAGLVSLKQYAIVSPGIAALPTFVHSSGAGLDNNFYWSLVVVILSAGLSFGLTYVFGRKAQLQKKDELATDDMHVYQPVSGQVIPLQEVNDDVFSKGLLGDGFAVKPDNRGVYSPVTGTVTMVAETKHAIGFLSDSGIEVLIHLGIDTVELNGLPFDIKIKNGNHVVKGQLIGEMNLDMIRKEQKDTTVIVALTQPNKQLEDKRYTDTQIGDVIGNVSVVQ
ncbi:MULTISPECIES: glucose PTS transporter subunit IIA [Lactiplantibacillus]|jgi:PTS system beta-glucosides-specific IIC component|uniref:PTS beta-glucoside transporter subunit EIIBCA n=2 Tax=Lactiplantibacillus pentosus TaxID=1589 RepID=A0ABX5D5S0_LACPE|nr:MULTISPECIES: glucose PTS transporter subunit IIA [Lactiplantibacillus]AYJ43058.1 PTS beta-glucoside transporter subunit EIIBCA [Lactiplantibacillus pentosus]KRK25335.1 pts system, glucose subfamily, iia component [Lactiplantibacillus pentosus DSM 20314]MCC3163704.1 glucose PTS transporter subunit IIA [Lactiplantibacillus pentosus]MCJ8188725.1 glucose PTS transporter subunit IIA [Lactiplantibacillus pentosus]MCM8609129.1 glucose PTS transporter subunit IIA [Lactiplantibacillus sp. B652]